jgi:phage-related tail fiber protein
MNVELNGNQSDTKRGCISLPANSNLTGKENLLWKVVNNNGVASFDLPAAVTDIAVYLGMSGDVQGNNVQAESPDFGDTFRVVFDGTTACNPGDKLSLSPNTWGAIYAPQAGAGAGFYNCVALEPGNAGQNGQLILVKRISERSFNL